eukprot:scaffold1377_cov198-Ochromonas_danica.AAC.8
MEAAANKEDGPHFGKVATEDIENGGDGNGNVLIGRPRCLYLKSVLTEIKDQVFKASLSLNGVRQCGASGVGRGGDGEQGVKLAFP